MSRSCNNEVINPSKFFLEWKSEKKCFQYWDKDKEENVLISLPFKFLVVDTLSTIKGYSKTDESGFWSNEVRNLKTEMFTVKTKKGECAKGLYENIMGVKDMKGSKYCQSVYIMMKQGTDTFIANIQMQGSALGQWIEFHKKEKIYEGAIQVKTSIEGVNGTTTYNMPVFEKITTTPESDEQAKKMDIELQEYLTAYFKRNNTVKEEEDIAQTVFTIKHGAMPCPNVDTFKQKQEEAELPDPF